QSALKRGAPDPISRKRGTGGGVTFTPVPRPLFMDVISKGDLMFEWLFTVEGWMSLLTLTILEIVLGIDNLVFLSIASQKLPPQQRPLAPKIRLLRARGMRILMLALLVWITKLVYPVFSIGSLDFSWRDI